MQGPDSIFRSAILPPSCRKAFNDKDVEYFIDNQGAAITHFFGAENVARQFGLVIANCDRRTMHLSVRNCMLGKEKTMSLLGDNGDVTLAAEPTILQVTDVEIDAAKSNAKCIAKSEKSRMQ